ncbi:hypothetical protein FRC09_013869 [Ceratobasidium sp. 395]|nr:hypothetical protein FRC09_013869 [Ceratobasidium sp. 395]
MKKEEVLSEEDWEDNVEDIPAPLAGPSATGLKHKQPAMQVSKPTSMKGSKGVSNKKIKQEKHTPESGSPATKKTKHDTKLKVLLAEESKPSTPAPALLAATSPTILDVESPSPTKLQVDLFLD